MNTVIDELVEAAYGIVNIEKSLGDTGLSDEVVRLEQALKDYDAYISN